MLTKITLGMKAAYAKILRTIKSSQNELHIKTCVAMIALFNLQYDDAGLELSLKEELDQRAYELCLLTR